MRTVAITLFALLLAAFAAAEISASSRRFDTSPEAFAAFERRFNKRYATRADRDAAYAAFQTNMVRAAEAQTRNPHATFGPTALADRPAKLWRPLSVPTGKPSQDRASFGVPAVVDWRVNASNVVPPVQDLGQCRGACVPFVLAGIGTGLNSINGYTEELTYLSSQQLMACTGNGQQCTCDGCTAEAPINAMIEMNRGIWDTAAAYPFTGGDSNGPPQCQQYNRGMTAGGKVASFVSLPSMDPSALMAAVAQSPVGVAVTTQMWALYLGGIVQQCGWATSPDYAVLLVGYDTEAQPPYWVLQNQWGTDWGENGFMRVAIANNTCLVQSQPFTLTMAPLDG